MDKEKNYKYHLCYSERIGKIRSGFCFWKEIEHSIYSEDPI